MLHYVHQLFYNCVCAAEQVVDWGFLEMLHAAAENTTRVN